jgi:hypothetical protein
MKTCQLFPLVGLLLWAGVFAGARAAGGSASPAPLGTSLPLPAASASPGETPPPPQFTTLDGVWEVELQTPTHVYYSHFDLRQTGDSGDDISGFWDWGGKPDKKVPLTGTFDGRLFKFVAKDGTKDYTFTGYVENYSDIVGMLTEGERKTAFTAEHRKKEKLINSISPGLP